MILFFFSFSFKHLYLCGKIAGVTVTLSRVHAFLCLIYFPFSILFLFFKTFNSSSLSHVALEVSETSIRTCDHNKTGNKLVQTRLVSPDSHILFCMSDTHQDPLWRVLSESSSAPSACRSPVDRVSRIPHVSS